MSAAKKLAKRGLDEKSLRKLIPLNALGVDALREIADKAEVVQFMPQRTVFTLGEQDTKTYYVLTGEVELRLASGQNVCVKADTPAALHPLSNTSPRQATAETKTHSNLLCIDRNLLEILIANNARDGYQVNEIHSDHQSDWMTRFLQSLSSINVPVKNIEYLMQSMEELPLRAGDTVIRQSDGEAQHYYVVKEGRCVVTKQSRSGKTPIRVAEISEGIGFGEEALLANQPRNASVTMLTDGRIIRWKKPDFARYIAEPALHIVDLAEAEQMIASGAVWIDVRNESEFRGNGLPGAIHLPLNALRTKCRDLNVYGKYIAYCDDGHRSAAAAFVMRQFGYPVSVLRNGLSTMPERPVAALVLPELKVQPKAAETGVESKRTPAAAAPDVRDRMIEELASLREQLHNARTREAAATARMNEVKAAVEQDAERARAQATQLQQRLARMEQEQGNKERALARLHTELDEARRAIEDARAKAAAGQSAQARVNDALDDARRAREKASEVALNLAATEAAHTATQADLNRLRAELTQARNEMKQEQARFAATRESQLTELNGMKQNLDREAERKRAAEEALKAAEREAARLKAEADAARRNAEELARRARDSETQHATMLEEIKRQAAAAEAQRREAEAQRREAEAHARKLKEQAEASRRKAEEEARRVAEAEAAKQKAIEESETRARLAEEIRKKADDEIARMKAERNSAQQATQEAKYRPPTAPTATPAPPQTPRAKAHDESQELEDIEQELVRLQKKLESKKRTAVTRKSEIDSANTKQDSELVQNVYDISQKTQKLPAFKPTQTANFGKLRKSGWVSDAILWETTLGLRDDTEAEKFLDDKARPAKPQPDAAPDARTQPKAHSTSQPSRAMASGELNTAPRAPSFTARDYVPTEPQRRVESTRRGNTMTIIIAVAIAALAGGGVTLVVSDRSGTSKDSAPAAIERPMPRETAPVVTSDPTPAAPNAEASAKPPVAAKRKSEPAGLEKQSTPAASKPKAEIQHKGEPKAEAPATKPAGQVNAPAEATTPATAEPVAAQPAPAPAVAAPDAAESHLSQTPAETPAAESKPAVREFSDKADVN